jgi:hypothetical protein
MESKAVFTQEGHKEAFKGLCINVLPLIGKIIENTRKSGVEGMIGITVATDGYFSFDIHNSSWKMAKLNKDLRQRERMRPAYEMQGKKQNRSSKDGRRVYPQIETCGRHGNKSQRGGDRY